jgi:DNA polymerase-3 subunit delta
LGRLSLAAGSCYECVRVAISAKSKPDKLNVVAVVGGDEGTVKTAASELAARLAPVDAGEFGVEVIDGNVDGAGAAVVRIHQTIDALQTFPFFGGGKLVWLKSVNFLADSPLGRAASVIEALESLSGLLSKGLAPDTRFLLSATETDKRRSFYKQLSKLADVHVYDRLDSSRSGWEEEAAGLVAERLRARGLRMTGDASELFTLLTGGDTRQIENELEKLELYLGASGNREIDAAMVRTMVPLSRAGIIFELGNAISRRDLDGALRLLDRLIYQGETPIGLLLVALVPTVRNLLLVKDLQLRHKLPRPASPFAFGQVLSRLPEEATAHLPRKKDGTVNTFGLGFAATDAHRFRLEQLREGLAACLEANVQLVTSQAEPRLVLERAIISLLKD